MCSNYRAAWLAEIEAIIADDRQDDAFHDRDTWPGYRGPVITWDKDAGRARQEMGVFGLVPHWARDTKICRSTYNARSETVTEKPSFKTAWQHANLCLIPMSHYYEPRYDADGKRPVRWSIARADQPTFCVAGIYWRPKGDIINGELSFSMLTINADEHPVLNQFHDPSDEKRSIVHVEPAEYDAWLTANTELARVMLELPPADQLVTTAAPLPPRTKKQTA